MAIEFRCTQCQRLLRTGDETAGQQAQCPECGTISLVPSSTMPSDAAAAPQGGNPFAAWQLPESQPPSDNPYQSPMAPMYARADVSAAQRVAGPATALIVTAVLGLIQNAGTLVFILAVILGNMGPPNRDLEDMYLYLFITVIGLPVGVVMLFGAMKMKKLESYGLAMTGAIIGMVPYLSPCCPLGLPFGIWALVVLSNGSVKAAFRK